MKLIKLIFIGILGRGELEQTKNKEEIAIKK
jgi:hypothetical protein